MSRWGAWQWVMLAGPLPLGAGSSGDTSGCCWDWHLLDHPGALAGNPAVHLVGYGLSGQLQPFSTALSALLGESLWLL